MEVTRLYEGFRAGVEPGGLTTDYEIKMLICYVLSELGRPMPISAMIETFVGEGLANYFETASAASGLAGILQLKHQRTMSVVTM